MNRKSRAILYVMYAICRLKNNSPHCVKNYRQQLTCTKINDKELIAMICIVHVCKKKVYGICYKVCYANSHLVLCLSFNACHQVQALLRHFFFHFWRGGCFCTLLVFVGKRPAIEYGHGKKAGEPCSATLRH